MKKWLQIVQKYIFQICVALFGILFIYSLIFVTPVMQLVKVLLQPSGVHSTGRVIQSIVSIAPNVYDIIEPMQDYSRAFMYLGIAGLVLTGVNIIYRAHIRKKYYKTNFVVMGLWMALTLGTSIYMLATIIPSMIDFSKLPIDAINDLIGPSSSYNYDATRSGDIVFYIIGIVLAVILLASCVCVLMLFIDKIKMQKTNKNVVLEENTSSENEDFVATVKEEQ